MTRYISILIVLLVTASAYGFDFRKENLEHKIVAGFNFGATTPTSIPREIRKIEGWWPQFTPQLGYNIIYNTSDKWAVGSGILLDYKGMGVRDRVKYLYTEVKLEKDGNYLTGYFTGKNETTVKMAYVTIPLYARFKINDTWNVRGGGYMSYAYSTSFKGKVWDGYMRAPDPTGSEIVIENKGDATFDFGDDVKTFDFGILAGGEMKINQRFNVFGTFNWGLTPIFHNSFKAVPFKMHNIYVTLGISYNL
ncbi:porin family protein [Dysgonomonas macrotermitis]|uniref:Outer membrane protein beta-barrel domain-containing protein n=1 Tax=Dysgonomonas macrotermitis TaxID=1346286 RepID=A0A1M5G1S0_9BACT|nr:porin family protein [Dysgonomonas macrotermitis]SHF97777.1 Outer membrane protein beta-barrel domain-containing protein [Dysgonomonas macrotermitis]